MAVRRAVLSGLASVLASLLGACAGTAPTGTAAPAPHAAEAEGALLREASWLRGWFEGTPVRVETPSGSLLRVDVPREFCFDPGRARVKPALAAVLAKLAESLRRQPQAELALVATPDDTPRGKALASERAAQVRRTLSERGVPLPQLGGSSASGGELLRLEITLPQG